MRKIVIEVEYENDSWPVDEGAEVEIQVEDAVVSTLVSHGIETHDVRVRHE